MGKYELLPEKQSQPSALGALSLKVGVGSVTGRKHAHTYLGSSNP